MHILCDTHILLWAITDDSRLQTFAKEIILNKKNTIHYSLISMWEIQLKHQYKKQQMPISGREFLHYCEQAGFYRLGLTENHLIEFESLQLFENHKDPFDRLLLSQSINESYNFMTHDEKFKQYLNEYKNIILV